MTMFSDFDAIRIGQTESLVKRITADDIRKFVEMTGDDNPLHVDRAFAETTSFKDVVVHGMLGASFISTVIGTRLPGPGALWVSQNLEFLLPVRLGDELTVTCTVQNKHERDRLLELDTKIVNQHGQQVLGGQGKVKLLAAKAPEAAVKTDRPKVAIVTGGAGGIGSEICRRLAADGYHVAINYLNSREKAERLAADIGGGGTGAIAIQADVTTAEGAEALYRATQRQFGAVTVLINNASPRITPKPFAALEWADLQRHLDGQLKAAFLMSKACVPAMLEMGHGRIIHIGSQATEGTPTAGWTGYAIGKGSLAVLARQMAVELGAGGITVNCVAPGMVETRLVADIPEKTQLMTARQTPLRRLATPADVAAAVAYLVGDGGFMTGQTIRVNGGMVML